MKKIEYINQDLSKIIIRKEDLESVEELRIWRCKKVDWRMLENTKNLKKVHLMGYDCKDLKVLINNVGLNELELVGVENDFSLTGVESLSELRFLDISTPVHWDFTKGKKVSISNIDILKKLKLLRLTLIGFYIPDYSRELFIDNFDIRNMHIGGSFNIIKKEGVFN